MVPAVFFFFPYCGDLESRGDIACFVEKGDSGPFVENRLEGARSPEDRPGRRLLQQSGRAALGAESGSLSLPTRPLQPSPRLTPVPLPRCRAHRVRGEV